MKKKKMKHMTEKAPDKAKLSEEKFGGKLSEDRFSEEKFGGKLSEDRFSEEKFGGKLSEDKLSEDKGGESAAEEKISGDALSGDEFLVEDSDVEPGRPRRRRSGRRKKQAWKPLCISCAALVLILYLLACASVKDGTNLKTTMVNGQDVSGLRQDAGVRAIEEHFLNTFAEKKMTIKLDTQTFEVPLEDCLEIDGEAGEAMAYAFGHGSFLSRGFDLMRAITFGKKYELLPTLKDIGALDVAMEESGINEAVTTIQTAYEIREEEILFTKGVTGGQVDSVALRNLIEDAIAVGDFDTVIEAPVIAVPVDGFNMKKLYRKLHKDMVEPNLDPKNGYKVVKAVKGFDFDPKEAQIVYDSAAEGAVVAIPIQIQEPKMTTKEFKKLLFRDTMSSASTNVDGKDSRINNISKAVKAINGKIILAGESFSFNKATGGYSDSNGYKKSVEPAVGTDYIAGGGVSQVSSTLYKAAVLADLDIEERHAHKYAPDFITLGQDAYVSADKNFKFKNNTDLPVKISARYEGGKLAISIIGTKESKDVIKFESKTIKTVAYGKEYWEDPNRYPEQSYVYVSGKEGKEVETYRKHYNKKGKEISSKKEASSNYASRNEITVKGTLVYVPPVETEPEEGEGTEGVEQQ